ncbi:MAG: hypothetical protein M3326_03860, partial [Actinomycetota bacterium]|nr:hypothetical protein [Actinomycetota bacterium]
MTATGSWTPVTLSRPSPRPSSVPWFHLVPAARPLVWLVEGSQLFELEAADASLLASGDEVALA